MRTLSRAKKFFRLIANLTEETAHTMLILLLAETLIRKISLEMIMKNISFNLI